MKPVCPWWKTQRSATFNRLKNNPLTKRCSADPKYEEEVSGCTASTAIISKHKIWVVR